MSDFQSGSTWQGKRFDEICRFMLKRAHFSAGDQPFVVSGIGIEIDAEVETPQGTLWVEFKGSYQGERPGLRRTDTVKKAIVSGALLAKANYPPYVIFASHRPVINSDGDKMLSRAIELGYVHSVVCVHDTDEWTNFVKRWS